MGLPDRGPPGPLMFFRTASLRLAHKLRARKMRVARKTKTMSGPGGPRSDKTP
jgi:hypothetical protein